MSLPLLISPPRTATRYVFNLLMSPNEACFLTHVRQPAFSRFSTHTPSPPQFHAPSQRRLIGTCFCLMRIITKSNNCETTSAQHKQLSERRVPICQNSAPLSVFFSLTPPPPARPFPRPTLHQQQQTHHQDC